MKYVKLLGLAAVAAAALMVLLGAGSASAAVLCSTNTSPCTGTTYPAGTKVKLEATGTMKFETLGGIVTGECSESSVSGTTSNAGGATESVKVAIPATGWTWQNCTRTITTTAGGTLEFGTNPGGPAGNGKLLVNGFDFVMNSIFGTCVYGWGATTANLGPVVGGSPATIEINTILPRMSGPCPAESRWRAAYKVVEPSPLYVE